MEEIELVGAIIDEVHAAPGGDDCKAEEAAGARWVPHRADQLRRNLHAIGHDLYEIAVCAIDCQDVSIWRDNQAQFSVERTVGREDVLPGAHRVFAAQRVGDRDDTVVQRVGDIQRPVLA